MKLAVRNPLASCFCILAFLSSFSKAKPASDQQLRVNGRPFETIYTEIDALKSDLANLQDQTNELVTGLNGLTLEVGQNTQAISDLEGSITYVEGLVAANTVSINELDSLTGGLRTNLAAAVEAHEALLADYYVYVALMETEIANLHGNITDIRNTMVAETDLATLVSQLVQITNIDASIMILTDAKETFETDIADINTKIDNAVARIVVLESDVISINAAIAGIQANVTELEGRITLNDQLIESLGTDLAALELRVEANEDIVADIESLRITLNTTISDFEDFKALQESQNSLINSQIATANSNIAALLETTSVNSKNITAHLLLINSLQASVHDLQTAKAGLDAARLDKQQEDIDNVVARIVVLESDVHNPVELCYTTSNANEMKFWCDAMFDGDDRCCLDEFGNIDGDGCRNFEGPVTVCKGACQGHNACGYVKNVKIGANACKGGYSCWNLQIAGDPLVITEGSCTSTEPCQCWKSAVSGSAGPILEPDECNEKSCFLC